jgi:ABC-type multidrug transport system fused ATPase/permease subunit
LFIQVIRTYTVKEIKAFSEASAVAQEVLGSIRTVTAFGGQKKEEKRFEGDKIRRNSFQT